MRHSRLLPVFAFLAALAAGGASAHETDIDTAKAQWNAYLDRVGRELRASGEPRDWALAATVFRGVDADPPPDASMLLANAASAAPDDALVQWAYLTHQPKPAGACGRNGPDPARLQQLAEREPDNAATWVMLVAAALQADDDDGADRLLERAAAASTFDDRLVDSIDAWHAVFRRLPPPMADPTFAEQYPPPPGIVPEAVAFGSAFMQGASMTGPSMMHIFKACDAALGAARDVRRYAYCAETGRRMLGAKVGITQLFGHALIDKSGLQTDAEAAARAALRAIYDRIPELDAQMADAAEVALILDDWRTTGGDETEVWRRRLHRAGIATGPAPP